MANEMTPAEKRVSSDMSLTFPGKNIVCKNCMYARPGVLGYRNSYCEMYQRGKPNDILFENAKCKYRVSA